MSDDSVGTSAARGGAASVLAQGLTFTMRLGSTAILARVLLPEDFGLVAMVVAIIGFAQMFQSAGLSMAIVQSPTIDDEWLASLFWVLVAFGLTLGLLIAATGPAIAWLYSEPRLEALTFGLALAFPFGSIAEHSRGILLRRLLFTQLFRCEVVSVFCGLAAGLALAFAGAGVWSLVAIRVVEAAALLVATMVMSRWRPRLVFRTSGIGRALAYGAHLSGYNLLNYVSMNADKFLVGRFAGATAIGNYSKGFDLVQMPVRFFEWPIGRVGLAALSHAQNEPDRFKAYYAKFVEVINVLCMPCVVLMAVLAPEVTRLVLGPGWDLAADILLALSLGAFVEPFTMAMQFVLMPLGKPRQLFRWMLIYTPAMVAAFVVGLQWGPVGVAFAYSVARAGLALPSMMFAFRGLEINLWGVLWGAFWRPAVAAVAAGGCAFAVKGELAGQGMLATLALVTIVHGIAYIAVLMLVTKGAIRHLIFDFVKEFRPGLRNQAVGP